MKEKETNEYKKNHDGKFPNINVKEELQKMTNDIAETSKELILLRLKSIENDKTLSEEEKKEYIRVFHEELKKYLQHKIRN